MIVLSQNKNILAEVISVRIINKRNKETQELEEVSIVGTMPYTGKDITLSRYDAKHEQFATKELENLMNNIQVNGINTVYKFGGAF